MNIFKNSRFGDKFQTRDGRMAIYCKYDMIHGVVPNSEHSITKHLLLINNLQWVNVFEDGSTVKEKEYPDDIVSEWQEEINEKELDDIASGYCRSVEGLSRLFNQPMGSLKGAFKAGYRKANKL